MPAMTLTALAPSGGCAAKYSAARLEELLRGFVPAEAENLLVGLAPVRRRGGLPARRRARARLHARLLPAARRRSGALRRDRGDERAQRRLRDGRRAAARALGRGLSGEPAERDARGRSSPARTSRCARRARSSPAATRSATTSRSTASPSSAPSIPNGFWPKAGAQAGRRALPDEAARHRAGAARRAGGSPARGGARRRGAAMTTLSRDAADALRPFAPHAVTDVTGFGLLGHAHELAERSGVRLVLDAGPLPRCPGRSRPPPPASAPAATAEPRLRRRARRHERGAPTTSSRSPTTRRPPAGCSSRSPPRRPPCSQAAFAARDLFLARIGRVEEGAGVALGLALAWTHRSPTRVCRRRSRRARFAQLAAASALSLYLIVTHRRGRPADRLGPRLRVLAGLPGGRVLPRSRAPLGDRVRQPRRSRSSRSRSRSPRGSRRRGRAGLPRWATWLARARLLRHDRPGAARPADDPARPAPADGAHALPARARRPRGRGRARGRGVGQRARPPPSRRCRSGCASSGSCSSPRAASSSSRARSSTAAGPHPGDSADIDRFWNLLDAVWLHVRATAAFGLAFLRRSSSGSARNREPCAACSCAARSSCSGCCSCRWRSARSSTATQLPWWLVLVHVGLAAAVWAWTVGLVAALGARPRRSE